MCEIWSIKPVGPRISELPKSALPAGYADEQGAFPFFCSSPDVKRIDRAITSTPSILMGTGGVATVHLGLGPHAYSTDTWAFSVSDDETDLQFLYRQIEHRLPQIDYAGFEGSGLRHLQKDYIRHLRLLCPPKTEQGCIAKIFDTLDTAIHETEAIIAKLKAVKQGLLHDLLTRGIDANGEMRPSRANAPHLYKESPLGWIPKEWDVKQLHEVGEAVTGTTPPSIDPLAWGSGTPFITPSEIANDRPISNSERQVSAHGLRYVRLLPAKTIVVVCIGSTIGKVGITATASCTNQQINAVLPYAGVHPEYLFLAIRMHIDQLRGLAGLQAVPIVNKTSFESIFVPVARPCEQIEIASV